MGAFDWRLAPPGPKRLIASPGKRLSGGALPPKTIYRQPRMPFSLTTTAPFVAKSRKTPGGPTVCSMNPGPATRRLSDPTPVQVAEQRPTMLDFFFFLSPIRRHFRSAQQRRASRNEKPSSSHGTVLRRWCDLNSNRWAGTRRGAEISELYLNPYDPGQLKWFRPNFHRSNCVLSFGQNRSWCSSAVSKELLFCFFATAKGVRSTPTPPPPAPPHPPTPPPPSPPSLPPSPLLPSAAMTR